MEIHQAIDEKKPLEIYEYSKKKLLELFVEKSEAAEELITKKNHSEYFDKYLINPDIDVKTIIVENDYIDRDFLEDFSAYYVRCFTNYNRKCTRLHFFRNKFRQDEFESFLDKYDKKFKKDLLDNYVGFIVIKRLPQTIIGRTCLRTYPEKTGAEDEEDKGDTRVYPIVRNYKANLCGVKLTVSSLAFQEQDNVVSACATSALWSAFQGTAILFQHQILSPVEITKAATKHLPLKERTFPNKGLYLEQMMHAVQELDMEPFLVQIKNDEYILKNYIYSYLTYGIPIILGFNLYDTMKDECLGSHAVVVTGYRLENKNEESLLSDRLGVVASNMSRIYVHDDQVGPFAKMKMDGKKVPGIRNISLSTELKHNTTPVGHIRAVPDILLIPLYHKIRIPLENILGIIELFNSIIDISIEKKILPVNRFEWDIFLTSVNKFKEEVLPISGKRGNFKDILKKDMPRYIWRAKALCKPELVMELLFDATDIEQGNLFSCGVVYNQDLFSKIQKIFESHENVPDALKEHPAGKSLVEFLKNPKING
jgi:hypothetical protein